MMYRIWSDHYMIMPDLSVCTSRSAKTVDTKTLRWNADGAGGCIRKRPSMMVGNLSMGSSGAAFMCFGTAKFHEVDMTRRSVGMYPG